MALRQRLLIRLAGLIFALVTLVNFYRGIAGFVFSLKHLRVFDCLRTYDLSKETLENLSLTEEQCRATFPGLMMEIDDAVARGPFNLEKEPDDYTGMVQLRIKDTKVYIITAEHRPNADMGFGRSAVLHQLHRAILTSPEPIPDTILALSILDTPHSNALSYARSNDPNIPNTYWLMPHYAFWSWPLPFIGSMDSVLARISEIEILTPWGKKFDKVVWRGTAWFNSLGNANLRPKLLEVTKGKEWADVEELVWYNAGEKTKNAIPIEDFCKYKYIIYTEGITYSGRLPFHQSCRSIILTPPITYLMHTTHLLRPLFSSSLPLGHSHSSANAAADHHSHARWPTSYPPSQANIIFISPDWSDLEATIAWLSANPGIAEGIANRQRAVVRKGFLSEAAEVCYWRSLIKGWASVVRIDKQEWGSSDATDEKVRGVRWEEFALTQKGAWE